MRRLLTILAIIVVLTASGASQTPTAPQRPPVVKTLAVKPPCSIGCHIKRMFKVAGIVIVTPVMVLAKWAADS